MMNTNSLFADLDAVDRDGAIRETAERASQHALTRRAALLASGSGTAALALAATTGTASAARSALTRGVSTSSNSH